MWIIKILTPITSGIKKIRKDTIRISVLKNVGISTVIKIMSMVTGLLMQLVLARLLGVKEFGDYTFVWAIFLSLAIIGKLGFEIAAIRFVAEYRVGKEMSLLKGFLFQSRLIVVIISIIIAFIGYIVIILLSHLGTVRANILSVFKLVLPLLPLLSLIEVNSSILRGLDRLTEALFTRNVLFSLIIVLLALLSMVIVTKPTAETVIIISFLAFIVVLAVQVYLIRRYLPSPLRFATAQYKTRKWLQVAGAMMLSSGIDQVIRQMDIIIVGIFIGTGSSGIYAIASRFARIVNMGLQLSNQSTVHMFKPLYLMGNKRELQKVVTLTAFVTLMTTVPIVVVLFFWPNEVLNLFGKGFAQDGTLVLQVLLVGQFVNSLTGPNGGLMQMTEFQNDMVWILVGALLIDVLLLVTFIPIIGVIGVALSTSVTTIVRNFVTTRQVIRRIGVNPTVFSCQLSKG